jgi:CheY-like chemotaxis protein
MSPDDRVPPVLRVLLVDDEHVVRHVLAAVLTHEGFVVDEAGDGQEALTCLNEREPDVVVTDLQMPRLDGRELCRQMKDNPATRRIPIILVTSSSIDSRDVGAIGCDVLIAKPVSGLALATAVKAMAAHREKAKPTSGAHRAARCASSQDP